MIAFALCGLLIGAILGTRFTMLSLIPAMLCALTIGTTSALMRDGIFSVAAIQLIVLLTFLQLGYLFPAASIVLTRDAVDTGETRNTNSSQGW